MKSPTYGELSDHEVIKKITEFIINKDSDYKFIIGTDSQPVRGYTIFVTALIVHRIGNCAIYFYQKELVKQRFDLATRMFQEVSKSLEFTSNFINKINKCQCPFCEYINNLEIHVDVGRNGQTRDLVNAVVGMVTGSGYNVKYKPESYVASTVADKHTKCTGHKNLKKLKMGLVK